jgi:TatA/E family protein of Tat protein translocase
MFFLDTLAFLDLNPIHVGFVLVLALLLFGPQKLPEIGRQLGSALRELKRAGSQLADSFNTDHEPDSRYNSYTDSYSGYDNSVARSTPAISASTDLSDYTIAGQPPADLYGTYPYESAPSQASNHDDYAFASTASSSTDGSGAEPAGVGAAESKKEGTSNV